MTILKKNPTTLGLGFIYKFFGFFPLTLTKRNHFSLSPHAFFFRKRLKVLDWVSSCTENENERAYIRRVLVARLDLESRWIDKLLSNFVNNIILDSLADLVSSDRLENNHLLE